MTDAVADYAPPSVTDANVMEVIANGARRILGSESEALIDLSAMADSDSTIVCALIEWILAGKKNKGVAFCNMHGRIQNLLDLYQMRDVIAPFCR